MERVIYQGVLGTVKHNIDRNMVEIYFNRRPPDNTIEALKLLRWRFYGKKACWHNRYELENVQLATKLCGETISEPTPSIDYYISPIEVMVVTSIRYCIYKEHRLVRGTASVNILKNGMVSEVTLPVFYCSECDVYYVFENDFYEIQKKGVVCARILTINEYRKIRDTGWEPISILRSFGYTVNSNDNYPDSVRREILEFLIENKILSAARIADYLAWFSRTRRNQPHMAQAIAKWDSDRNYILSYQPNNFKIRVRNIYIKKIRNV